MGLAQRMFSDTNGIMLLHGIMLLQAIKTVGRGGIAPRTLATNGGEWSASRRCPLERMGEGQCVWMLWRTGPLPEIEPRFLGRPFRSPVHIPGVLCHLIGK